MNEDFDWSNDESVVFTTTQGVAVFANNCGDVVIWQEAMNGEDDERIYIPSQMVKSVIKQIGIALKRAGSPDIKRASA